MMVKRHFVCWQKLNGSGQIKSNKFLNSMWLRQKQECQYELRVGCPHVIRTRDKIVHSQGRKAYLYALDLKRLCKNQDRSVNPVLQSDQKGSYSAADISFKGD